MISTSIIIIIRSPSPWLKIIAFPVQFPEHFAMQLATYIGSAAQPARVSPTHKLAFYNVGWQAPSKKHDAPSIAMNDKGTTVMTHGVKDLLADDGREYTLIAHCTTDSHTEFILTPSKRTGHQAALVVIRGTLDSGASAEQPLQNFLVESILPLRDDDAKSAKASLLKLISWIALAGQHGGVKRENSGWSEDSSPCKIAKCRSLTRYPTGEEIPAYSQPE